MSPKPKPIDILIAEDNNADVLLVKEALREYSIAYNLHVVNDGESAVRFLERTDNESGAPCPDLLLLDLNLPKRSGAEILKRLRSSPKCGSIPVIVLTGTESPVERKAVEQLGADRLFRKPMQLDDFLQLGAVVRELIR